MIQKWIKRAVSGHSYKPGNGEKSSTHSFQQQPYLIGTGWECERGGMDEEETPPVTAGAQ